ncbi:MAG: GyrI-like domain-containing protein [Eubacteriaceae bacterium]|jgi:predicted transcriptional regulator YdeE
MVKQQVVITDLPVKCIYGLSVLSNDLTIAKDIKRVYQCYKTAVHAVEGDVVPLFVGSKDYNETTGDFTLFIGSDINSPGLRKITLPGGEYAHFPVKPKFGRFWGSAIGKAKRRFYGSWLPRNGYESRNIDFEYHTQKSLLDSPEIDMFFAVKKI